jgi:hypothetical protein
MVMFTVLSLLSLYITPRMYALLKRFSVKIGAGRILDNEKTHKEVEEEKEKRALLIRKATRVRDIKLSEEDLELSGEVNGSPKKLLKLEDIRTPNNRSLVGERTPKVLLQFEDIKSPKNEGGADNSPSKKYQLE